MRRHQPKRWRQLMKLKSHVKERGPGTEAYEETQKVIEYLGPILAHDPQSAELLPQICGIIDVNAVDTNPPEGSMAIYETACLLEHNCLSNTRLTFEVDEKGRPRINVIAVKPIKKYVLLESSSIYGQIQKTGFSAVLEAHSRKFFCKFVIVFLPLINDVP